MRCNDTLPLPNTRVYHRFQVLQQFLPVKQSELIQNAKTEQQRYYEDSDTGIITVTLL